MPRALSTRGVAETGGLLFGRVFPSVVGIPRLVARFSSAAPFPISCQAARPSRPFLERALHVQTNRHESLAVMCALGVQFLLAATIT